jgi:two-component system LytT family response regulator
MIKAVIIDDEEHARENLKAIIRANFQNVDICGEGDSVDSAVEVIQANNPDLIFLDIDLSDGSAFNVLEELGEVKSHVVFVTAFNEYAVKAFRYNALDYILKPINVEEVEQTIAKFEGLAEKDYVTRDELKAIINNLATSEEDKKLIIRDQNSVTYARIGDILRCEADSSYSTIYLVDGSKIVSSRTLKEYADILPETLFFRIHQSNLINLKFVMKYAKEDGGFVVMKDGTNITIARRRKEEFFAALEKAIS